MKKKTLQETLSRTKPGRAFRLCTSLLGSKYLDPKKMSDNIACRDLLSGAGPVFTVLLGSQVADLFRALDSLTARPGKHPKAFSSLSQALAASGRLCP